MCNPRYYLLGGFMALCLMLIGCGGMDFGNEINVSAEQRHTIAADTPSGKPISLPADHAYNIHMKKSSQNPGADGQARGESSATADGNAYCLAEASSGGSASAEFNIGHRIDNHTDAAQNVVVEINYELAQSVQASKQPDSDTLATTNLHLVVRDSRKRIPAKMALVNTTSDDAVADAQVKDQRSLTVRFEPGLSYDIMLYGKVDASGATGQKAAARLDIKNLKMKCTFTPADIQTAKE
ncbi:MAG: hypothetical protein JSV03_04385 [Planctomycetota bacterium]|nr:MAG: hypothetical protein JSV03_04385 [Planctomycetota bacterium]